MNESDFHTLVTEQTGLNINQADLVLPLDQVSGWDSVYLLRLISIIERETGQPVSVPAVLEAATLDDIRKAISS